MVRTGVVLSSYSCMILLAAPLTAPPPPYRASKKTKEPIYRPRTLNQSTMPLYDPKQGHPLGLQPDTTPLLSDGIE